MRVRVKICGITTVNETRAAIDAGADAVGFVFAESPRRVDIALAKRLMSYIPPFVTSVAVFRYPVAEEVTSVVSQCAPDLVQAEPTTAVNEAVPASTRLLPVFHEGEDVFDDVRSYSRHGKNNSGVLLEASGRGGRGITPDWDFAAKIARVFPLVLAGGLTPENVEDAICHVRPFAVDVSSGVESSPGSKDPERIRDFILTVRRAEALLKAEVDV